MASRLTFGVLLAALGLQGSAPPRPPASPFETQGDPAALTEIDKLVLARLAQMGIEPSNPCSDAVFVRRVYLDVTGTLPSAREAGECLASCDPEKRAALIDRLLEREEFADYRAMRLSDVLRIKAEFPINLWPNAAQAYHRWVRTAMRENMPYDQCTSEIHERSNRRQGSESGN